jgi:hypothetical protein
MLRILLLIAAAIFVFWIVSAIIHFFLWVFMLGLVLFLVVLGFGLVLRVGRRSARRSR